MKKRLTISGYATIVLGIVSFIWLMYDIYAFGQMKRIAPNEEMISIIVSIGIVISYLFHISALLTIVFHFQYYQKIKAFGVFCLVAGVVSMIGLFSDWAAMNDIGEEYIFGFKTGFEFAALYGSLLPHILFNIMVFVLIFRVFRGFRDQAVPVDALKDDVVFTMAHFVGIVCGIVGLGYTLMMLLHDVNPRILCILTISWTFFILMPYGLICLYWLIVKRNERISEWYDEKQFQDVAKAGFTALIASLPLMTLMFTVVCFNYDGPAGIMWFPYYLFIVLLIFSGNMLFFNARG